MGRNFIILSTSISHHVCRTNALIISSLRNSVSFQVIYTLSSDFPLEALILLSYSASPMRSRISFRERRTKE